MSDERWTRDQKLSAAASVVGVVGIAANFIDPITEAVGPVWWVISPFALMGIGAFIGFSFTRMLDNKRARDLEARNEAAERECNRLLAKLDETRRERDYARERADIVPGLSKAASDVYNRLDERDRLAMQRLAAASVVDHYGAPTRPLVMAVSDVSLEPLGLSADGLRRLEELGAVRTHTRNGHALVISHGDGERGTAEPGVRLDGPDALLDLPGGTFRIPLTTGCGWDGRYASPEVSCADLGVVEYTDAGREVAAKVRTGDETEGLREYIEASWATGYRYTSKPFIACK